MKRDPVEQTPEYLAIEDELESKILKRMENMKYSPRERSRLYDEIQKKILKKDYGIEWKSPRELNPRIKFD